jgi:hypothetical protein
VDPVHLGCHTEGVQDAVLPEDERKRNQTIFEIKERPKLVFNPMSVILLFKSLDLSFLSNMVWFLFLSSLVANHDSSRLFALSNSIILCYFSLASVLIAYYLMDDALWKEWSKLSDHTLDDQAAKIVTTPFEAINEGVTTAE